MTRILILLLLSACAAQPIQSPDGANFDLILNDKREITLNRPVTIKIVHDLPHGVFGMAENAYETGVCTIYLDENNLRWLYHELQHCDGEHHPEDKT
jgi:hypothetical protein